MNGLRRTWLLGWVGAWTLGCGTGTPPEGGAPNGVTRFETRPSTAAEAESRIWDPFYTQVFPGVRNLYIAPGEPGASNDNNGLYPTYRGGTDGPFASLDDSIVGKIGPRRGVRLFLRSGTYRGQLELEGEGEENTPFVLSGYPGDHAILDADTNGNGVHDVSVGAGNQLEGETSALEIRGWYVVVENLTIQNGHQFVVHITGDHVIVRDRTIIGHTIPASNPNADAVKTSLGANFIYFANNDVSAFGSQGIDAFGAGNLLIKNNTFHDGDALSNAIGTKSGSVNLVALNNTVRDFPSPASAAIGMGGNFSDSSATDASGEFLPSSRHAFVAGNTITNFPHFAGALTSCYECTFADNTANDVAAGFDVIATEPYHGPPRTIPVTVGARLERNRVANMDAVALDSALAGVAIGTVVREGAEAGFGSSDNLYYSDSGVRFAFGPDTDLTLAQFRMRAGTASGSQILPLSAF